MNGWDNLTNVLKLNFSDLVYYGERAIMYEKKREKQQQAAQAKIKK